MPLKIPSSVSSAADFQWNFGTNVDFIARAEEGLQPSVRPGFKLIIDDLNALATAIVTDIEGTVRDASLFQHIYNAANNLNELPLEVDFKAPAINVSTASVRRQNTEIKYASWTTVEDIALSFYNFVNAHTYRFFYYWAMLAGGFNRTTQDQDTVGYRKFVHRPAMGTYKMNARVMHFSGKAPIVESIWHLRGLWPNQVSVEDYDNADEGNLHKTMVTFAIDFAFPEAV